MVEKEAAELEVTVDYYLEEFFLFVMDEQTKLILALYQVDGITQLTKDNEYRHYLYCKTVIN